MNEQHRPDAGGAGAWEGDAGLMPLPREGLPDRRELARLARFDRDERRARGERTRERRARERTRAWREQDRPTLRTRVWRDLRDEQRHLLDLRERQERRFTAEGAEDGAEDAEER